MGGGKGGGLTRQLAGTSRHYNRQHFPFSSSINTMKKYQNWSSQRRGKNNERLAPSSCSGRGPPETGQRGEGEAGTQVGAGRHPHPSIRYGTDGGGGVERDRRRGEGRDGQDG